MKRIQYFHSELRPSFAGWPGESEDVIPANTAYIALEELIATANVFLFFPCWPPAHGELSNGLILGCRHALKLSRATSQGSESTLSLMLIAACWFRWTVHTMKSG